MSAHATRIVNTPHGTEPSDAEVHKLDANGKDSTGHWGMGDMWHYSTVGLQEGCSLKCLLVQQS